MKKYQLKELEKDEKKWIETVLRMELADWEKINFLESEGYAMEDVLDVLLEMK